MNIKQNILLFRFTCFVQEPKPNAHTTDRAQNTTTLAKSRPKDTQLEQAMTNNTFERLDNFTKCTTIFLRDNRIIKGNIAAPEAKYLLIKAERRKTACPDKRTDSLVLATD